MSGSRSLYTTAARAVHKCSPVAPRHRLQSLNSSIQPRYTTAFTSNVQSRCQSTGNQNGPSRRPSSFSQKLPDPEKGSYRHPTFDVVGRVYVVTGGAQGLGLSMVEALAENGAHVYCLDRLASPSEAYRSVHARISASKHGSIAYRQVDVRDASNVDSVISQIAHTHKRLDGLSAAAGIQYVSPALDYPPDKIDEMMAVNFKGVYLAAVSCARQMIQYQTPGAMLLVGSTSGINAIKGFTASVYCGAKAGVIQMARSLAMEWGKAVDGRSIRVNALCPGNIVTPMVRKNFQDDPGLRATWERENMMGRLSEPEEFKGATLFLLSDASSFMTGASLVVDGGYTAW